MEKLRFVRIACLICTACALASITACAQTFNTVFSFDYTNGALPNGLVQATDGNFYGTTYGGGLDSGPDGPCPTGGCGTVFKLTPSGTPTTLYQFCSQAGCSDGANPYSGLIQASDGNLYGTTGWGGANSCIVGSMNFGCGTVFKITSSGELTTLHSFDMTDGDFPVAGLVQASDGNLYGTTEFGGGIFEAGTVFKITTGGTLTTLYEFCSVVGQVCTEGGGPAAGLIQATDGNLYGTAAGFGANNYGTVFKITTSGTLTALYSFCAEGGSGCTDGALPMAALVQASDGNLYGTTIAGGDDSCTLVRDNPGCGTIFKITLDGALTILHSFDGTDGAEPNALVQAKDGNLYGTAQAGGAYASGSAFRITTSGTLGTLYSFCSQGGTNCTDGEAPLSALIQATNGNLYGTTNLGGAANGCSFEGPPPGCGTVFSLTLGRPLAESPTLTVDFYGDGEGEPAVWRPSDGTWYVHLNSNSSGNLQQVWGESGDVLVAADYDGDGKSDYAIWRPSNGTWYIIPSSNPNSPIITQWGEPDDVPVAADYDGDGKADIAVWRPSTGTWYILPSDGGPEIKQVWGLPGDVPVIGDYDGDGKADYAVWRPSNYTWYVILSSTGKIVETPWGLPGDMPVEGDYDGDGKTDYAIWRPSTGTWYVIYSSTGQMVSQPWGITGDIPVVGDYNGDGKNDYAVWRPSNATWYVMYSSGGQLITQWGETGDIPATHLPSMIRRDKHIANFDGDRKTDLAVFRPSTGTWYVIDSSTGNYVTQSWGLNGDIIVPGDYDGDGKTDYAIWRPSNQTWYIIYSSSGKEVTQQWGASGDIPVPGDYDGDGKTDYAVWRPSTGKWYVILSSTGQMVTQSWGLNGDIPVPADYDGDGKTDYAVWRPSNQTWYIIYSSSGKEVTQQWGASGDIPVPGDYDGDTKADYTVFRPSNGTWYTIQSSTGNIVETPFGQSGDIPVAKDYDGDEKTDIAVWRPSNATWYILQSSNGKMTTTQWGESGDVPVNQPTGQ